jgi:hypothetical protein
MFLMDCIIKTLRNYFQVFNFIYKIKTNIISLEILFNIEKIIELFNLNNNI